MRLFHATTFENMKKILKDGFNPVHKNWTCSEEDKTYFFTEEYFMQNWEIESDEGLLSHAIPEVMDQARIALAVQNPKDYRGVVMIFETEYMDNGSEVETDYSCDNMDHMAVCLNDPDMKGLVSVYVMKHEESSMRLDYLALFDGRAYFPEMESLSPIERAKVEALKNHSTLDIISDINSYNEYVEFKIKKESNLKKKVAA